MNDELWISREDARIASQALNEVLNGPEAIEDWEFQTRMGVRREEALDLLERIQRRLADGSSPRS